MITKKINKSFNKILASAAIAIGLTSPLSFADQTNAMKSETYSMVVFLRGSEFFNWSYAGMQDAAKRLGSHINVELQGPAEWDAAMQARTIGQLTARKVDGIIVTAGEANTLVNSINKAVNRKIPVITFDSDSPDSKRLAFVGTNNYNAGYSAGETVSKWVKSGQEIGVSTMKGPAHLDARVRGFEAAIKEFSPNTLIHYIDDQGSIERAGQRITALLQANPKIGVVFAAHGNPTTGAAQAVRDLGLKGKVKIMGFDYGKSTVELMESGEVEATVGQNPYL